MRYINSISIDGTKVTEDLLQHAKLIKITRSDKVLADHLFLIINKAHYKGPLPKEHFVIEFTTVSNRYLPLTNIFYIDKDDNKSNRDQLNESEKALANDPNNVVFHGLSVKTGFTEFYEEVINIITSPPAHIFKNQTLKEVLEYMRQALDLDELITNHKAVNSKISFLKVNKIYKKEDGSYTKTIIEELADIFYAAASIRDNKLYFIQKRYSGGSKLLRAQMCLSNSQVQNISNIKGLYDNQPKYKGVSFSYFTEIEPNNIKKVHLGKEPFLKLDTVYEKCLAKIYAESKLKELYEPQVLKLTIKDIQNRTPGCYLQISKAIVQEPLEKRIADIIGNWSLKECIITYGLHEQPNQDPNEAGPSSKKAKLEPSWSTTLHLIKITE